MKDNVSWKQALSALLQWMDIEQPEGALLQHHGIGVECTDDVHICLADGAGSRPTFVFTGNNRPAPVEVERELQLLGVPVLEWWGCHPEKDPSFYAEDQFTSYAIGKPFSPTLRAAFRTYHSGCPTHPKQSVFCVCGWYQEGYDKLIKPETLLG